VFFLQLWKIAAVAGKANDFGEIAINIIPLLTILIMVAFHSASGGERGINFQIYFFKGSQAPKEAPLSSPV
jgi:hypothetical protein